MIAVEKIIPGGQALGTHPDGRKIFFWNALLGEQVTEFEITKRKSHYYEAIATQIEHPSSFRVEPKDPCFLSTSPWQIVAWPHENQLKSELVQEIFREHKITIAPPPIHTDDHPYFYRNKMEYSLYWDNATSKIELAFHARGSHRKLLIQQSSLERPEIFAAAQKIVADLNAQHAEARQYQSLLLRVNQSGQVSGGLYENHRPHPHFPPLSDTILGHTYSYSPNGFFQINLPVYELALQIIRQHIATDRVLDLYSGVGTIGLSVARDRNLTLVESDPFAFQELCHNLLPTTADTTIPRGTTSFSSPAYPRISAHLAKSETILDFITPDTTVILDPPRAGCHPDLINHLLAVHPASIIYLSCNPATQARDLVPLLAKYQLTTVQTFNFFPRTPHIENLTILSSL